MENEWLANPGWWFAGSEGVDTVICEKFGHLLDEPDLENVSMLEKVLRFDQLARHIYRNEVAGHIIEFFLQKALRVVEGVEEWWRRGWEPEKLVWILLPLRHSGQSERAVAIAWRALEMHPGCECLRAFLRASYKRCTVVGLAQKPKETGYILSLSGGVDSMVCSQKFRHCIRAAIHINYCNRETSGAEAAFVTDWCRAKNIPCYVREIREIQRAPCMKEGLRNDYETYTRKVRFECYRDFGENSVIMLGHNKTDTLENIFTNIASKSKYDNLSGMVETSCLDGIVFNRPLLDMTKEQVIEYAAELRIPHLPCSTPTWSQRGQIRASVVPVLDKWHPGFTDSLYDLSAQMADMHALIVDYVDSIYVAVANGDLTIATPEHSNNRYFWKLFLERIEVVVSAKSLDNFMDRLKAGGKTIVLNKEWTYTQSLGTSVFSRQKIEPVNMV